jgi:hypothetical protein
MTTQATHTPGPWAADPDGVILGTLGPARPFVGRIDDDYNDGQTAANRRLVAAAPEMLEALRAMVARAPFIDQSVTEDGLANCEALARARRAIRRAEGEQ